VTSLEKFSWKFERRGREASRRRNSLRAVKRSKKKLIPRSTDQGETVQRVKIDESTEREPTSYPEGGDWETPTREDRWVNNASRDQTVTEKEKGRTLKQTLLIRGRPRGGKKIIAVSKGDLACHSEEGRLSRQSTRNADG